MGAFQCEGREEGGLGEVSVGRIPLALGAVGTIWGICLLGAWLVSCGGYDRYLLV